MLLRFYSKAGSDVVMLAAHANPILAALGRTPADQGVFLPEQIPTALAAFAEAVHTEPEPVDPDAESDEGAEAEVPTPMGKRAWPLCDLLRAAAAQGHPVIWQPL